MSLKLELSIRTMSADSLLTMVLVFLSHSTGTVYLPAAQISQKFGPQPILPQGGGTPLSQRPARLAYRLHVMHTDHEAQERRAGHR